MQGFYQIIKYKISLFLVLLPLFSVFSEENTEHNVINNIRHLAIHPESEFKRIQPLDHISVFQDPNNSLGIESIQKPEIHWDPLASGETNLSYTKSRFWLRLPIENNTNQDLGLVLDAQFPILRRVEFHIPEKDIHKTIDRSNPDPMPDRWETFPFPFTLPAGEKILIYISIESYMDMVLDLELYREDEFHRHYREKSLINGFFYGVIGIMIFYNFFLFVSLGKKVYLAYVLYSIGFLMYLFSYFGIGYKYIWGDWVWFNDRSIQIWMSLGLGVFGSEFLVRFLNSREDYRMSIIRSFRWVQGFAIFLLLVSIFMHPNDSVRFFPYASLGLILMTLYAMIRRIRDGYTPAWFLLAGFVPLFVFGAISSLRSIGVFPNNLITLYGPLYASALDLVFLSLGLAYTIRILQKNEIQAKLANKTKSEFIAQMSHEIRTPLQGLEASIDLLVEEDDPQQVSNLKTVIKTNLKNLTGILNDILDFSKMEAGLFTIHKEKVDIHEIITNIHFFYQAKTQEKNLDWILRHPETKIPPIITDGVRIQQVLNNLISNAVKFTEKGKIELSYGILTESEIDHLFFRVEDTGIGIQKKSLGKLFQNFVQAEEDTSQKFGGTGLGLAICKKIANLMDGDISAESELGKGSRFSVSVPIEYAKNNESTSDHAREEDSKKTGKIKILVLEDSPELQMIIQRSLEKLDYKVVVSSSIEEAIPIFLSWKPAVILSDYHLKGETALDLMQALRESSETKSLAIPQVYVLTGEHDRSLHDDCKEKGIESVFLKPVDFRELNLVVRENLSFVIKKL